MIDFRLPLTSSDFQMSATSTLSASDTPLMAFIEQFSDRAWNHTGLFQELLACIYTGLQCGSITERNSRCSRTLKLTAAQI